MTWKVSKELQGRREIALFDIEEIMFGLVNFLRTIISKNTNDKWKLWKRITLRSYRLEKKECS